LALVMNGGVSLAVWMGGVSAEIDRLRRAGRRDAEGDAVLRLWEQLVTALDVRVTVDVIAGTSAGGLNGAALATSIARGTGLPDLRETWLKVAAIKRLAEDENEAKGDRPSVLNGEMFAVQIRDVFRGIADSPGKPPSIAGLSEGSVEQLAAALSREAASPRAVTLYTTATSLRGKVQKYADVTGEEFDQVEYRVVCEFRRDLHGCDGFAGEGATDQLSRAARASASFPVAFAPAFFSANGVGDGADPLTKGPDMNAVAKLEGMSRWVIDGGVLDNEPFGPVLDEIARRPISADVDRVVAYVVPEGGLIQTEADHFDEKQGMIGPALAALNLPREVNLANQLDRLRQMERDVFATRDDDRELFDRAAGGGFDQAVTELLGQYRAARLAAAVWEARTVGAEVRDTTVQMLSAPDELRADDSDRHGWLPTSADLGLGDRWLWGPSAAERVLRLAMSLQRRAAREHPDDDAVSRALVALSAALWHVQETRHAAHDALKAKIKDRGGAAMTDGDVLELLDAHYASDEGKGIEARILDALRFGLGHLPGDGDPGEFAAAALKVEVVRRATAGTEPYRPTPRFRFYRFGANCGSPLVAGGKSHPNKLLGLRAGHFGGFLDRWWRAYDWTWGRMDGATQLVGMLTNPRALEARFSGTSDDFGDDPALAEANQALADLRPNWDDAETLRRLRDALLRPFHRAILADELAVIVEAMGEDAPPDGGGDVARFQAIVDLTPTESIDALRNSEGGHETTVQLVADGLRALSQDPKLPLKDHLDDVLRGAATAGTHLEHLRHGLHRVFHPGEN
jgi:predicted acylesterase/phospholipase RssA